MTHKEFRVLLAEELLMESSSYQLTGQHFPAKVSLTPSGQPSQPLCVVCSIKKRKTTTYKCKQCDLPLCSIPCFELYHTKADPACYIISLTHVCNYYLILTLRGLMLMKYIFKLTMYINFVSYVSVHQK